MIQEVIACRYAKALVTAAFEKNELASTREDLLTLVDIISPDIGEISAPELMDFLQTPTVTVADKIAMTDRLCEKLHIGKLVSDFLNVLIKHRRINIARRVIRHYIMIASKLENISEAVVTSALALTAAQQENLKAALQKKLGNPVRLICRTNEKLLAGLQVKVGDILLDNSAKGRMARLETSLL